MSGLTRIGNQLFDSAGVLQGYIDSVGNERSTVGASLLWANRPTNPLAGTLCRFIDVGGWTLNTGGGAWMFYTGTRWKPVNGNVLIDSIDTANSGIANTSIQQLNPNHVVLPAAVLLDYDRLRLLFTMSKSGAVDTATIRFHWGPLGTTADPVVDTITDFTGTAVTYAALLEFKRTSATALQKNGNGNPGDGFNGASTVAFPAAVTVSSMDTNPMYMSISQQMTGGTEFVTLQNMTLEIYATDS